ncbi:MAG: hypothetical protein ABIL49_01105 [candidate division WOR-3 bacterium]
MFKKIFIFCLLIYILNFIFRIIFFKWAIVYNDSLGGSNMDALFWTSKDVYSLSPLWYFLVKIIGSNFKLLWIINFISTLISIWLMYLILNYFNFSQFTKSIILLSSVLSPYILFSSLKVRPDTMAMLLSILSLYLALKNKPILSGISYGFSIFGFKIQFVVWLFILLFTNRKNILKFIFSFGLLFIVYYFFLLDFEKLTFFKSFGSNVSPLLDIHKNITYQTPYSILGFFSQLGFLYILGFLLPLFNYALILPPFPLRSLYSNFILNLSSGFLIEKSKNFKIMSILLFSIQLIILVYKFALDIRGLIIENKFYQKIYELKYVCANEFPAHLYVLKKEPIECKYYIISDGSLHKSEILNLENYKIIYKVEDAFSIKNFIKSRLF